MAKKKDVKSKTTNKKSTKNKKVEKAIKKLPSKARVALAVIAFTLVAAFLIVCYFNPAIYQNILNLFKEKEESNITNIVGDDVYVNELTDVNVHFVNVGQGDSIVITLPDDTVMLIDAFNDATLLSYLKDTLKLTVIDYVLITHSDADHIGAMDKVFENFQVKKVFRPYIVYGDDNTFDASFNKGSKEANSKTYKTFLELLSKETYVDGNQTKECEWEFFNHSSDFSKNIHYNNETYTFTFDFLTPTVEISDIAYGDVNSYSPIVKFSYAGTDVLFTGDAEHETLEEFLDKYTSETDKAYLDVEVLKLGHHGSKTSTTDPFLDVVKPEYAIASCGVDNSYGHPHAEVLDLMLNNNVTLYRTDLSGNIVLNISTTGFEFNIQNPNVSASDMYTAPTKD